MTGALPLRQGGRAPARGRRLADERQAPASRSAASPSAASTASIANCTLPNSARSPPVRLAESFSISAARISTRRARSGCGRGRHQSRPACVHSRSRSSLRLAALGAARSINADCDGLILAAAAGLKIELDQVAGPHVAAARLVNVARADEDIARAVKPGREAKALADVEKFQSRLNFHRLISL